MRIAIDGRALTGRFTGDRTYWRNLLHALPGVIGSDPTTQITVYSREPIPAGALPDAACIRAQTLAAPNERIWSMVALPLALRKSPADVLHVQYTVPLPGLCPCPVVTTVHDISFKLFPEWFPPKDRFLLNLTVPFSMRCAARVITVSESSRRDILRVYRLPPEKVAGILHGLPEGFDAHPGNADSDAEVLTRYGVPEPFVLAVGVLQPRKNLHLLAEAFGKAKRNAGLPHFLVLAGKAGWATEQHALRQAAAKYGGDGAANAVHFPGYIADEDLPALYRRCAVFAYPSLYEGFGLPPLEAMACRAPVIVSNAPAMPEVAGDAALFASPHDSEAWAEALVRVLTDGALRERLASGGPAHAARFTWRDTAAHTLNVYKEACGQK